MASANPDLTTIFQIPSPTPPDPPDVPGDMKALADRVDAIIPRIKSGMTDVSINASGDATITHGLGVQPDAVVVSVNAPGPAADYTANVRTVTPTTFAIRPYRSGALVTSATLTIHWIAVKSP